MATFGFYRQAQAKAWTGQVNWLNDTIVITQHTAGYTPNLDTHAFVSDLTNEVSTGGGYTTGGIILTGKSAAYTPANAWSQPWAAVTSYLNGQIVRANPGNGLLFRCVTAGTSGVTQPAWPSEGLTVLDGSVTWAAVAPGAVQLFAQNVQWLSYSGTLRYLVISDRTSALATAQPLLALADLTVSSSGSGGNLDVNWDPAGALVIAPA